MSDTTPLETSPTGKDANRDLLVRSLYEEQSRLRAEIDQLRRDQLKLQERESQKQPDSKDKEGEPDKKNGEGQDGKEQDKKGKDQQGEDKEDEHQQPPAKEKARNWIRSHPIGFALSVAGFAVLVIAGIFLWKYLQSYESTDDAQVDGHVDPISPRIAGFVVGVYVENTYRVKKGQVLVDLDPRDYVVALEQARANLAQAQANAEAQAPNVPITKTAQATLVENARLAVQSSEAALAAAEHSYASALADLQQAETNASNAVLEEERYRKLVAKQEVSREIYDQRATDARAQSALVLSRRATADAALKTVTQSKAALAQSQESFEEAKRNQPRQISVQSSTYFTRRASAMAAKAQVSQALLNLTYCKIVAPEDGIIGDKSVQKGSQVSPGQELLAVTETKDIWVTANFKETQIRNMRPGQSVTIYVDALSQKFNGFVEALPGATGATYSLLPPENATGNYVKVVQRLPVRIRFKPGQPYAERLAPGMSVEPKVWVQ